MNKQEISKYIEKAVNTYSLKFTDYLKLSGNFFITADWHLPNLNIDFFDKFLFIVEKFKEKYNIKELIIIGDFLDFENLGKYDCLNSFYKTENDFEVAKKILKALKEYFNKIYWLIGNHDIRYLKGLEQKLTINTLFDILQAKKENLVISNYPYAIVISNKNKFRLTHPSSYSRISGRTANTLSSKYRCSVINTHNHFFSIGNDVSGNDACIDLGIMADGERIFYRQLSDTNHPVWNNGFGLILNGSFFGWCDNKKITNWEFWKNIKL